MRGTIWEARAGGPTCVATGHCGTPSGTSLDTIEDRWPGLVGCPGRGKPVALAARKMLARSWRAGHTARRRADAGEQMSEATDDSDTLRGRAGRVLRPFAEVRPQLPSPV